MSQEQQDIADLKAWRKVTEPALRELAADSKLILAQVADISAKMANHQSCPAPAQCNALELRVRTLEDAKTGTVGVGKAIIFAGGAMVSGLLGAAGFIGLVRFFSNKSMP